MTKPQYALDIRQPRLAEEVLEDLSGDPSAPVRKIPGGEPWGNNHPVNIRLSFPLIFGRYYVTVVAGKERRSGERLASEGAKHPLMKLGNLIVMAAFGTICGLAALSLIQLTLAQFLRHSGVVTFGP